MLAQKYAYFYAPIAASKPYNNYNTLKQKTLQQMTKQAKQLIAQAKAENWKRL